VKWNDKRRKNVNIFLDTPAPAAVLPQFLYDSPEIPNRSRGVSIPGGVDPQHPVLLGEPQSDVFLAQGIAIPVITETDDVVSF
jgi:hypothetical protein